MRLSIVPMKPLARAKARLAPVLSPEGRRILALAMLTDVLAAATAAGRVWVLNSDEEAAAIAARAGAEPREDPAPGSGLNASIEAATTDAIEEGIEGILVLAADLPLVTAEEVRAVAGGSGVAVAPSLDGQGTNALWRSPPRAIPSAFGGASRLIHEALARARHVEFRTVELPGLGLDIDRPEDLARLLSSVGGAPATRAALERLGFPNGGAVSIFGRDDRAGPRRVSSAPEVTPVPQGTIKTFDPDTGSGIILDDARNELEYDRRSWAGSPVREFRLGQRVRFVLSGDGKRATVTDLTIITL